LPQLTVLGGAKTVLLEKSQASFFSAIQAAHERYFGSENFIESSRLDGY
jgi:hypothetical protein